MYEMVQPRMVVLFGAVSFLSFFPEPSVFMIEPYLIVAGVEE